MGEVVTASRPIAALLDGVRSQAGAAPLDFVAVKLVTGLFGDGTVAARLWAFAAGCMAIPLGYAAAIHIFRSRTAGLIAAGLIAISPFLIVYSREARFYSMSVAAALFVLFAHQIARRHHPAKGAWILYSFAVVVATLTHYYLVLIPAFLLGASLIEHAWHRTSCMGRRSVAEMLALGAAVIAVAPWLTFALPSQLDRRFPWTLPDFTLEAWGDLIGFLTTGSALVDLGTAVAASALVSLAVVAITWQGRHILPGAVALCALSVVPVAWFLAARSGYQVSPRQVILVLPLLLVLAAGGFARVSLLVRPRAARVGLGFLAGIAWIVLMWGPIAATATVSGAPAEDWPAASEFVIATHCPGGTVYSNVPSGYLYGIAYYERALLPFVILIDYPDRKIQDAISDLHLGERDTVVVLTYIGGEYAPGWQGLWALSAYFRDRNWTEHRFGSQLYVYSKTEC